MTTAEYWYQLPPFDHVVTYSFNRGPKLEQLLRAAERQSTLTRQELAAARFMRQRALQQRLDSLAQFQYRQSIPLTSPEGAFDITAEPVACFGQQNMAARQLGAVLTTPADFSLAAGCAPVFRDALAFHDAAGTVISVLNICFQCRYMRDEAGTYLEADVAVYPQLETLLRALGHPIKARAEQADETFPHDDHR